MTGFLASVSCSDEALLAADYADLIDFKDPSKGALGALSEAVIRESLAALRLHGDHATSATTGDLPLDPPRVTEAVRRIAGTGVDYVKIGLFDGNLSATLTALEPLSARYRLIAVQFADRSPNLNLARLLSEFGFCGVMLDTADKSSGSLTRHISLESLETYVAAARDFDMIVGLAGSLTLADIPVLLPLGADYLGFRSALSEGGRNNPLSSDRLAGIRNAFPAA